jgi:hypothetical protein
MRDRRTLVLQRKNKTTGGGAKGGVSPRLDATVGSGGTARRAQACPLDEKVRIVLVTPPLPCPIE